MTGYQGFDRPQGPGWWQANDGKWYPPESAPGARPAPVAPSWTPSGGGVATAPAPTTTHAPASTPPAPPQPTQAPRPSQAALPQQVAAAPGVARRPTFPMIGAIAVLVIGALLAITGLVAGGPDESARAERRDRLDQADARLAALQGELSVAESGAAGVFAQGNTFLADADAIMSAARNGCDCTQGISAGWDSFLAASAEFYANPNEATQAAMNDIIENRLNPEGDRLLDLQDELRTLMADRAMVPEATP